VLGANDTDVDTSGVVDGSVFASLLLPHAVSKNAAAAMAAVALSADLTEVPRIIPVAYPAMRGPNQRLSAADDLAGLDARGAGVDALLVAAGTVDRVHDLDVRVPATVRPTMGVRNGLTEARAFPADIAYGSHVSPLLVVNKLESILKGQQPDTGDPTT
jgi:hypothetical protein